MKSVFKTMRGALNTSTARCSCGSANTGFAASGESQFASLTLNLSILMGARAAIAMIGLLMKKGIQSILWRARSIITPKGLGIFSRLFLLALILMLSASSAGAQVGFPISNQNVTPGGTPASYARITVCPYTASGVPCSPQSAIYSDPNLTVPLTQPYSSDQYGNYNLYVANGPLYLVQVQVNNSVTYSYDVWASVPGSGPADVTLFGAVCNAPVGGGSTSGATDDSAAIEKAINATTVNGTIPGTILLPPNKWCAAKGLVAPSGLTVTSPGPNGGGLELLDNANENLITGTALGYAGVAAANLNSSTGISAGISGTCVLTFANGATGTVTSVSGTITQQGVVMTSQGSSTTTNYTTAAISNGTATGCTGTAALTTRVHEVTDVAPSKETGASVGTNQVTLDNVVLWGNQENQSGNGPYYDLQIYGYATNVYNSILGDAKGDCMQSDFDGSTIPFYDPPTSDLGDFYRNSVFVHCGGYWSGMSFTITSPGAVGLRHIGPSDSHLTDVILFQNAAEELYIGVNAAGMKLTKVHPWGSRSFIPVTLIESSGVSGSIVADGNPIAFIGTEDSQLTIDAVGGSESGLGHPVVAAQLGQAAGGQAFAGSVNQLIPGNLSPGATDSLAASALRNIVQVSGQSLLGGCVNYVSGQEFYNSVTCTVDNTAYPAGAYITGTPSTLDIFHIVGSGLTCPTTGGATIALCGGNSGINFVGVSPIFTVENLAFMTNPHAGMLNWSGAWTYSPEGAQTLGSTGANINVFATNQNWTNIPVTANSAGSTGVTLSVGNQEGWVIYITNRSTTGSITFAVSSSNVAGGSSVAIAPNTAQALKWDTTESLWYPIGSPSGNGSISGMTATQIPVAGGPTSITGSLPTTGSGNVVLSASPTLTGTAQMANINMSGGITGLGGSTTQCWNLAGTTTTCPTDGAISVGTTPILLGTNGYVLTQNGSGNLGESPKTGSGNVVFATSPTLTTPTVVTGISESGGGSTSNCWNTNGGTSACAGTASNITVGSTGVIGGASGNLLYDNGGLLGVATEVGLNQVTLATNYTNSTAGYTTVFTLGSVPTGSTYQGLCVFNALQSASSSSWAITLANGSASAFTWGSVVAGTDAQNPATSYIVDKIGLSTLSIFASDSLLSGLATATQIVVTFSYTNNSGSPISPVIEAESDGTNTLTIFAGASCKWL